MVDSAYLDKILDRQTAVSDCRQSPGICRDFYYEHCFSGIIELSEGGVFYDDEKCRQETRTDDDVLNGFHGSAGSYAKID